MHFCMTGQYTPKALNGIMENPTVSRYEAAKKLIEAAGGKLISMYSTATDGPGVLVIFDVPDPNSAPAISGTVVAPAPSTTPTSRGCGRGRNRASSAKGGQASWLVQAARWLIDRRVTNLFQKHWRQSNTLPPILC